MNTPMQDSPVERRRKELPRGNAEWAGYSHVWNQIQAGCMAMARNPYLHLSEEHIEAMASLGSGHEETMKATLWHLRDRGFIQ